MLTQLVFEGKVIGSLGKHDGKPCKIKTGDTIMMSGKTTYVVAVLAADGSTAILD